MTDMYDANWDDLIWHDPPPSGRWGPVMERFTGFLAKRPGEWGEMPPPDGGYPVSLATNLRKSYGDKGFEFRATAFSPGSHTRIRIYGRQIAADDPELKARTNLRPVRGG